LLGVGGGWLYAIGDVNGRNLLTHMGKYQGRLVGDLLAGRGDPGATAFADVPIAEYVVDVEAATVSERPLESTGPVRHLRQGSPITEAMRPGTYAPAPR